jgi:hypothetical protein
MGCPRVELLHNPVTSTFQPSHNDGRGRGALQKSIDFTPFEPRAGPTGGEGLAWPAPTISLTIWFFWIAFRAIAA